MSVLHSPEMTSEQCLHPKTATAAQKFIETHKLHTTCAVEQNMQGFCFFVFLLFFFLLLKESKLFSDESTKARIVPRTLARTRNPDRERSELMAGQE